MRLVSGLLQLQNSVKHEVEYKRGRGQLPRPRGIDMNATRLPLLLFALLAVGCSSIGIEGQFLQPADVTATALATSIRAALTSTPDPGATAAIERAVKLTLTAAVPSPTNTPPPSPTAEPTTAIPPTETLTPTATKKPAIQPSAPPP